MPQSGPIHGQFRRRPEPYDGDWLALGNDDADLAWVQQLGDDPVLGLMTGDAANSDPANVDMGTHNEPRNYDQNWMVYNEDIDCGLDIPAREAATGEQKSRHRKWWLCTFRGRLFRRITLQNLFRELMLSHKHDRS